MELSTHRHILDFAILTVLASESSPESCSPPALTFICAQERCTLPGRAILSKVRPSFSWRFRVFQSSTTGEIELIPQPELTLSGSDDCLEGPGGQRPPPHFGLCRFFDALASESSSHPTTGSEPG